MGTKEWFQLKVIGCSVSSGGSENLLILNFVQLI